MDYEDKESVIRVPSLESVKPDLAADPEVNVAPILNAQDDEWVTGSKLFNIITAVALVCFSCYWIRQLFQQLVSTETLK